jgi:peptidoglycan hydrolase-like protein with peptidoglycan-binding domain
MNQPGMSSQNQPPQNQPTAANRTNADESNTQTVQQAQQALKSQGLYSGPVDGINGPQTERAVSEFQRQQGLPATAALDQQTLARLMGAESSPAGNSPGNQGRTPTTAR